ncbi:RGLG2 [Symbiodinium natans]|uniref:Ribosomal protein n=1 Tax=Symbiodinium natans TaxID=878477 RepID=A0A812NFV7_9DINO|nr:RGLG2 [Symbiodinium natans]
MAVTPQPILIHPSPGGSVVSESFTEMKESGFGALKRQPAGAATGEADGVLDLEVGQGCWFQRCRASHAVGEVAAAVAVAAFSLSYSQQGFVPPPAARSAKMTQEELAPWDSIQDCLEDGLDGALTAAEDFFNAADGLVGPSPNPQLLPAGSAPLPKKDGLQQVIEPLTKLYMRYRTAIYPRCKECQIIVRFGKLWRTCRVRRHKQRQPGITGYKRRMNRYKGWKQLSKR